MAKKNTHYSFIFFLMLAAGVGYYGAYTHYALTTQKNSSDSRCALRTAMRTLWADHVFWTRNYIIAALAESSDMSALTDRLLKNQKDIGNAMIPYYGKEAGQKLTALLKEHILIAIEIIAATKAHHDERLKEADERWHRNAVAIATFLHNANEYWQKDAMIGMLYAHLTLTTEELIARLQKEWKADISTFDKVINQALDMADHFTNGIVAQFPHKF